MNYQLLIIIQ